MKGGWAGGPEILLWEITTKPPMDLLYFKYFDNKMFKLLTGNLKGYFPRKGFEVHLVLKLVQNLIFSLFWILKSI